MWRMGASVALAAVFGVLLATGGAWGTWLGDFLDADASGNATYEAMAITPSAVYDAGSNATVVAYQGANLDPYVCVLDHDTGRWSEPVRVGSNAYLAGRMDTHGGPSIIQDADGVFHVFWGAHNTRLYHAVSATPGVAGSWKLKSITVDGSSVTCTYPVPELYEHADGTGLRVWMRRGEANPIRGDIASIVTTNGVTWTRGETVIESTGDSLWYDSVFTGDHATHIAFIRAPRTSYWGNADAFVRQGLYYVRSEAEGVWTNANSTVLPGPPVPEETILGTCTVVDIPETDEINQVVVRELPDGNPCILYLQGDTAAEEQIYSWRFTRFTGMEWTEPVIIAETDHFFDAADLEVDDRGGWTYLYAYVTTGGRPDNQALVGDPHAARGGDLARFTSGDLGETWSDQVWVKQQDGPNARYNDPQVVRGAPVSSLPRVLFCEWNNDASAYFQKVFLWGEDGLFGREVTPEITRLAGLNRVGTAVEAAKKAYPVVSPAVVLARKDAFPDALCGAPLAHAYRAPILLVSTEKLDAETRAEIQRLRPSRVLVLGGTASISTTTVVEVQSALYEAGVTKPTIERFPGTDRYDTSALIAERLRQLKGSPSEVVLASGADFPDALAASPYAARRGEPILLTRPDSLTQATYDALRTSGASDVYIVGGEAAVSGDVEDVLKTRGYVVRRAAGANRYETAQLIVERGLGREQVFGMQRFVVASGETFPDAMTGGVLAARVNGPLLLTRSSGSLSDPTRYLIDRYADRVLDVYVMGGAAAIDESVVNDLQIRVVGDTY
jgi:putative cell wall-binding protein